MTETTLDPATDCIVKSLERHYKEMSKENAEYHFYQFERAQLHHWIEHIKKLGELAHGRI